jgi:hypothetical protein
MGPDRHGKDESELARNTPVPFLPLAQDATEKKASTVTGLSGLFGSSGWFSGPTDKTDEIDQTNQLRFASNPWPLSCECEGARLDNEPDASHDWKDKPPSVRKCLWPLLYVAKQRSISRFAVQWLIRLWLVFVLQPHPRWLPSAGLLSLRSQTCCSGLHILRKRICSELLY